MADVKVLNSAQIRDSNDKVIYDLAAHGKVAVRITTKLDDREISVIAPMPETAPKWVPELLAFTVDETIRKITDG